MKAVDLLVVGAGPSGSAIAATMARAGASVVLVEAARHPRPKACAEYASPRIVEELARIGLDQAAWRDTAVPLRGMEMHAGGRSALIRYAGRNGQRMAWGVDRRRFDERLSTHATESGAELRDRTRVVGLLHDEGRVTGGRLRDLASGHEERVLARWTVGADGARSTVARLEGVERAVRFPRRLGLVAHYAGVPELADHGEMHVGARGYVGLAPTPGGELNVGMALPLDRGEGRPSTERFEAAIAAIPAVAGRLAGA
ncbi:MAG: NAD(P)/FAD-dependent oxidoreductase, partial [Candidatus Limnocylindria bacterium]